MSLFHASFVDLPHNPYIGFFHGTLRLRSLHNNRLYLPTSNPHVGVLRHAPSNVSTAKDNKSTHDAITHFISQLKVDRKKVSSSFPPLLVSDSLVFRFKILMPIFLALNFLQGIHALVINQLA